MAADLGPLRSVLGPRPLRRSVQLRLGSSALRVPVIGPTCAPSLRTFLNNAGQAKGDKPPPWLRACDGNRLAGRGVQYRRSFIGQQSRIEGLPTPSAVAKASPLPLKAHTEPRARPMSLPAAATRLCGLHPCLSGSHGTQRSKRGRPDREVPVPRALARPLSRPAAATRRSELHPRLSGSHGAPKEAGAVGPAALRAEAHHAAADFISISPRHCTHFLHRSISLFPSTVGLYLIRILTSGTPGAPAPRHLFCLIFSMDYRRAPCWNQTC